MHGLPVAPDALESTAMSAFCGELSVADWHALETLEPRLRNALLKRTIAIALRWRHRRTPKRAL